MSDSPLPNAPQIATQPVTCDLCGSDDAEHYADSYDYEYGTCSNRWRFVRCVHCGNVYLNPRPHRDTIATIYPPNYYSYNFDQQIHPIARAAKAWLDRGRFKWMQRQLSVPLTAYLDVGCGNGRYLRVMADAGLRRDHVYGTELDEGVVRSLRAEGFNTRQGLFEEITDLPESFFQLVTFFSVLEHVPRPLAVLGRARSLLAPGGIVLCEVPNVRSWNGRLFRDRYWGGYHTPRHWNLFSAETFARAIEPLGFRVRTIKRGTGHAFWMYSFHHYVRYHLRWERLGRWLHPSTCLPGLAVVTAMDLVRARLNQETDNTVFVLEGV